MPGVAAAEINAQGQPPSWRRSSLGATPKQLRKLNELGALVVVAPGTVEPISMGEASYAIGVALNEEAV